MKCRRALLDQAVVENVALVLVVGSLVCVLVLAAVRVPLT